jgi:hypothetical protein
MSLSPPLRSAGLVVLDRDNGAVLRVVTLQLTPDGISRTVTPRGGGDDGADPVEIRRLTGPPVETITLEAELDAVELASGDNHTAATAANEVGLHAVLAELESLVRPALDDVLAAHDLAALGAFEVLGVPQPDVLLVWGRHRVVPVRVTDLSVTEEGYDGELNPLRATVSISLRVLTVNDVGVASRAGSWALAHHAGAEALADRVLSTSTARLGLDL